MVQLLNTYFVGSIKKNCFKGVIYPITAYNGAVTFKTTSTVLAYAKKISYIPIPIEIPVSNLYIGNDAFRIKCMFLIAFSLDKKIIHPIHIVCA